MLWEGNRQIQEYTDKHIFTTVYDQDSFEPVARVVQSRQSQDDKVCNELKIYHYHNNHLGTPQELTDECGNVIWANYEFAWGGSYQSYYKEQSLNNIPIDKDHLQPIKFQGQFFDTETSLHYNRFRYYDSDVGMFIQRDPIGLLGGINIYQYADNPVMWIDPLGLAGKGGAYMFEWLNGGKYIGKGLKKRFGDSKSNRKNDKLGPDCLLGEAWISTNGDNEMGKMVENRAMFLSGFDPTKKGKASVPSGFANAFMSGNTAYNNATPERKKEAERLAKKLIAKFEADKAAKLLARKNCVIK